MSSNVKKVSHRPASSARTALSPLELAGAWFMGIVAAGGAWMWATAQLAALVTSGGWISVPGAQMARIALEIAQRPGDPRGAFPAETAAQLPGPVGFWAAAAIVGAVVLVPATWLVLRRLKPSTPV